MTNLETPQVPSTPAPMRASPEERLQGIGGWLILVIIGLFTSIAFTVVNLLALAQPDVQEGYRAFFEGRVPAEYTNVMKLGLLSTANGIILVALATACLVQMFRKKRGIPFLMTAFYVFNVWAYGVEWYGVSKFPMLRDTVEDPTRTLTQFLGSGVRAVIWITYFQVSERVKNTFVN